MATLRYGKPHDIGGAVAFLASDDASYMISEAMVIGGEWDSRMYENEYPKQYSYSKQ